MGKIPRSDKVYADPAEKMQAYRQRRKLKEQAQVLVNALLDAATEAARAGDATAYLYLTSTEPDIFKCLTSIFKERPRQIKARKAAWSEESILAMIMPTLTGKPREQPTD